MTSCRPSSKARTGTVPVAVPTAPSYELCGPPKAPVVVVLGGISASRHVTANESDTSPGWWQEIVGSDRPIDVGDYRVLSIDWVTAADSIVTTGDQADALALVLDHLRIQKVRAVVGASYGGMVALTFAARYPLRLDQLVVLAAAHQSHPMATANRVLQRRVVQLGLLAGVPRTGLALARGLGITTYRSAGEFAERFAVIPRWHHNSPRFEVEDYLDHGGNKFANSFDAQRYMALSESLDLHSVDPADVKTPTTLLGIAEDQLVPPWQMRELRDRHGGDCQLHEIASRYGHDAFLKEVGQVGTVIGNALALEVNHARH